MNWHDGRTIGVSADALTLFYWASVISFHHTGGVSAVAPPVTSKEDLVSKAD